MKKGYVYITTNRRRGVLYIGCTSNLPQRISQHKSKYTKSFTNKYNATKLVWYYYFENIADAVKRERQLKKRKRQRKISMIEINNIDWRDLSYELE